MCDTNSQSSALLPDLHKWSKLADRHHRAVQALSGRKKLEAQIAKGGPWQMHRKSPPALLFRSRTRNNAVRRWRRIHYRSSTRGV
jgi:hypothetical protein